MAPSTSVSNIDQALQTSDGFFFGYQDIGTLLSSLMGVFLTIAGLALLLYLGYGGMQWLTAGGDKQAVEKARQVITNALIGLAIVAASWAVYKLVIYFFQLGSISLVS